jgi:uncharacterized protein
VSYPTVELRIIEVKTAVPAGNGVEAGQIGLQELVAPWRILRMIIGQPEARAIHSKWKGMVAPRPLTWDLFISTLEALGAGLKQVNITAVEEERHFFASIEMEIDGESRVLPCRPSDAIALAIRSDNTAIMTTEEVMGEASVLGDGTKAGYRQPEPEALSEAEDENDSATAVGALEAEDGPSFS